LPVTKNTTMTCIIPMLSVFNKNRATQSQVLLRKASMPPSVRYPPLAQESK
jgi:hypothetical protein